MMTTVIGDCIFIVDCLLDYAAAYFKRLIVTFWAAAAAAAGTGGGEVAISTCNRSFRWLLSHFSFVFEASAAVHCIMQTRVDAATTGASTHAREFVGSLSFGSYNKPQN